MFLLIDNYDSFTYNLAQYLQCLGETPVVLTNDDPKILELAKSGSIEKVLISPGPSHPAKAGLCLEFLKLLDPSVPVLGVCLGHQILGLFAGSEVVVGPAIMHGMQSDIEHDSDGLFTGLPQPMRVGRYHSLVVVCDEQHPNPKLKVTARGPLGEVMALAYTDRPWVGVQFHPESVLTPEGMSLLANFPARILPEAEGQVPVVPIREDESIELKTIMDRLGNGQDLDGNMAKFGFEQLMDGEMTPCQAGAFLMGLRSKGETALEMSYAVRTALARAVKVEDVPQDSIDIVGTGGDGRSSFNCSTCTALTLAGMGYHVIKHGNRAISSTSGAADALESLGIPLEADPNKVLAQINKTNFGFFFAPYYHPSFKNIGPIRRDLGIRTLFNILGPMINPAKPPYLLMGVARPELVNLVADTLLQSNTLRRVAVVYGAGGYDEVTPMGASTVVMLENGQATPLEFDPARWGIEPCTVEDLAVYSKEEASKVLRELLQGQGPKPMQDMVILNATLALHVINPQRSLDDCFAEAKDGVLRGAGRVFIH